MADQSRFSKYDKGILFEISKFLIESGDFSIPPYDDFDTSYNKLEYICRFVGVKDILNEDVEFFAKFIEINEVMIYNIIDTNDKSLTESLQIPIQKDYLVEYESWGTTSFTDYMEDTWESYDEKWVKDSIEQARQHGIWSIYDGRTISTSYDNTEMSDWEYKKIREKKSYQNENFDKNKIIESLDKKTLLELRGLIDNKLKRL